MSLSSGPNPHATGAASAQAADRQLLTAVIDTLSDIAAIDLEPTAIMQAITERTCAFAGADGASLELLEGTEFVCQAVTGLMKPYQGTRFGMEGRLSGHAIRLGQALFCADSELDPRVDQEGCRVVGARSMIVVPLPHNGRFVGTLKVLGRQPNAFKPSHVDGLKLMASLLGAALNHALEFEAKKALLAEHSAAMTALRESEERFRSAFEYAAIGKAIVGLDGRWLQVNRAICEIVGYSEAELLATDFQSITHPDDLNADLEFIRQLVAGEIRTYQMTKRYLHKDGRVVWVLLSVSLIRDEKDKPLYFISQIQDVTERTRMELMESDHRHVLEMVAQDRAVEHIVRCLLFMAEAHIPDALGCFLLLHGGQINALGPSLPEDLLLNIKTRPVTIAAALCGSFEAGRKIKSHDLNNPELPVDFCKICLKDDLRYCLAIPIDDADGSPLGLWTLFSAKPTPVDPFTRNLCDIITHLASLAIRRQLMSDGLARQAHHDPLTGLPNRGLFADRLDQALASAARNRTCCAVMFLDVDHFKSINDTLGHDAGDRLLYQFSRRIRVLLRETDTLARIGGDEFALVLPNLGARQDAIVIAKKIIEALREPFRLMTDPLHVTASIGISLFPADAQDAHSLQKGADAALYQVKRRGRNGYEASENPANPPLPPAPPQST